MPNQPVVLAATMNDSPLFDEDQMEELIKEYDIHKRKLRQVFAAILDELRKSYRTFTKKMDKNLYPEYDPEEHMDLMIMEDKVHSNCYETPDDFKADVDLIARNIIDASNSRIPAHREHVAKVNYDVAMF